MNSDRDERPSREEPEYHIVRPEQDRSAYSDAYYRAAPREGRGEYGYNPAHYYASQEDGYHRGQIGLKAILALCLVCVIVAGVLGIGGLYILFRDRRQARLESPDGSAKAFYSQARQAQQAEGPFSTTAPPAGGAALAGEDIYRMACPQVVGVTAGAGSPGSGIVLSADGYILTNYHVIETGYARDVSVTVTDMQGREYLAQIVGTEADSDLAVLKIDAQGLTPAQLGDSAALTEGVRIYAVSGPLGSTPYTMTRGVVSARDRSIKVEESAAVNMFQFDAAVNGGNSGGPVYNAYGQVVGVATGKYAGSGVERLSFAIPISDACFIANELIANGYVSGKAYLGLGLTPDSVSPAAAQYFRMVPGAYVSSVEEGSAAEEAGLQAGDIITAVDGTAVTGADEMIAAVRGYKAGDQAELTVYRDGEYLTVTVTFGEAMPRS